jgi:hypothetical protein
MLRHVLLRGGMGGVTSVEVPRTVVKGLQKKVYKALAMTLHTCQLSSFRVRT